MKDIKELTDDKIEYNCLSAAAKVSAGIVSSFAGLCLTGATAGTVCRDSSLSCYAGVWGASLGLVAFGLYKISNKLDRQALEIDQQIVTINAMEQGYGSPSKR